MQPQDITYKDMPISDAMKKAIEQKGYILPTPIQREIIPLFLNDTIDMIGQASTGTGKTASFGIPLIELIDENSPQTEALIMCPTRELAIQVAEEIKSLATFKEINITLLYGGNSYFNEERGLRSKPKIIVGTPGRIKDHLDKGNLKLQSMKYFILDEADEMLNIGFREAIEEIMKSTPQEKRVLLFSATMPKDILRIAEKYMRKYKLISVKKDDAKKALIDQSYYTVGERQKFDLLSLILDAADDFYGIIFCKRKIDVDEVNDKLRQAGYKSEGIHSDFEQKNRERILKRFKSGETKILVATDVAARGIDVNNLTHVINYGLPENSEVYTHRVGRTGRAGKEGIAITFVTKAEQRKIFFIERDTKMVIKRGKIPTADEVVDLKKKRILEKISGELKGEISQEFKDMASQLSLVPGSENLTALLLQKYLGNTYFTIKDFAQKSDFSFNDGDMSRFERRGSTKFSRDRDFSHRGERDSDFNDGEFQRLFIAKGRKHGVQTPVDIMKMIEKDTGVYLKRECKIDIFQEFTFVNVRGGEAKKILKYYKDKNREKPLVVQAKRK